MYTANISSGIGTKIATEKRWLRFIDFKFENIKKKVYFIPNYMNYYVIIENL